MQEERKEHCGGIEACVCPESLASRDCTQGSMCTISKREIKDEVYTEDGKKTESQGPPGTKLSSVLILFILTQGFGTCCSTAWNICSQSGGSFT